MNQSFLLEGINGNFLVFSFAACIVFLHYMWANFGEGYRFLRAAIAMIAVFGGEVILRANFWYTRHLVNGGEASYPNFWWTIIGSGLTSWGILCVIFVFAPERWRFKAAVITVVSAIGFLYVTLAQWV